MTWCLTQIGRGVVADMTVLESHRWDAAMFMAGKSMLAHIGFIERCTGRTL